LENDKKEAKAPGAPLEAQVPRDIAKNPEMEDLYRRLEPELHRSKPNADAIAAALEAAQRFALEADAEHSVDDTVGHGVGMANAEVCQVCGHSNRAGNKFCAMCGIPIREDIGTMDPEEDPRGLTLPPNPFDNANVARPAAPRPSGLETHHYHHHYHHHYFPGGYEGGFPPRPANEPVREEKVRANAALRGDLSRAEAAVRRITQEWVLACNTKHLDDLLDLYTADALVLRSNYPPVRGAAAVREFFFGALEAGLGEVEVEPLRLEVVGDLAYEAGRCKALVPSATGKRREERGKYLWVCSRQGNGDWKLTADCWSSDLSLSMLESDVPANANVKTGTPRKG
jgi:ketosteroid isomerase-like protein